MAEARRRTRPARSTGVAFVEPAGVGRRAGGPGVPASLPVDPAHTFDSFVIGPGNRLAHAAALAVAELPGEAYNPLFLHGPPGLGKTHLLGAIAGYLRRNHPELQVHHTTAERFTTEFVAALRSEGPERFKQRYRELDALLIDDVQVLEGKARTEEEFVHTFNALFGAGKQIVLSSDRPPAALAQLARAPPRPLRVGPHASSSSRRICAPGPRCLWRMAARSAPELPDPAALQEIAGQVPGNVRLLEGAMTRVVALASRAQRADHDPAGAQGAAARRVRDAPRAADPAGAQRRRDPGGGLPPSSASPRASCSRRGARPASRGRANWRCTWRAS